MSMLDCSSGIASVRRQTSIGKVTCAPCVLMTAYWRYRSFVGCSGVVCDGAIQESTELLNHWFWLVGTVDER